MRPDLFLATIGRGSNGSNALEVTEDRAAVTAESQDNIINLVNNVSQYGASWHYVPGIGVAGTAYAEVPGSATGDLAFSRASSKTRTNASGVVETIAANVPPHDYRNADGTLSTFPRLNLEPQRTNSIRNSSMVGAVAGSPGTIPTNWVITSGTPTAGLTQTISLGTENGLPYVDFRYNGTTTSTTLEIRLESLTQIAALTGQAWTLSAFLKVVSGTVPSLSQAIYERTSAGVLITSGLNPITPTTTLQRFAFTRTLSGGATVAAVQPALVLTLLNATAYDFTIRIAAPQMELGNFASTWVPTTTAAVTRLEDRALKTGLSSLIGQTSGTLFVEWDNSDKGIINLLETYNNASTITGTSSILIQKTGTPNQLNIRVFDSLGNYSDFVNVTLLNGRNKLALAYQPGSAVYYLNGISVGGTTRTYTFGSTRDTIAFDPRAPYPRAQAALFPTRLTNAQLAQLTTL